jgi:hypothetical protein
VTANKILFLVILAVMMSVTFLFVMLNAIMLSVGALNDAGDKRPWLLPPEKVL